MRKHSKWIYFILIFTALTLLIPLLYVILLSFSGTGNTSIGQFTLDNYKQAYQSLNFFSMNINSLIISVTTILLSLWFSSMAAFALAKINIRLNNQLLGLFFLGLFMPGQVLIVPVYQVLTELNLIDLRLGLILYYVGSSMAFSIFFFNSQLKTFPKQLIEAAQIEGASWFTVYYKIVIPYLKPAIITIGIMNFIGYWNEMFYALIILQNPTKRTVTIEMIRLADKFQNNIPVLYAGLILGAIPIIIFYFIFQGKINQGENAGAVK